MIKKASVLCVCIMCLILSSCTIINSTDADSIITFFEANMAVYIDDKEYDCEFTRNDENIAQIKVIYPDEISGLTYNYRGEGYNITYNNKTIDGTYPFLPDSSFSEILINILSSASNKTTLDKKYSVGDSTCFSGTCEEGQYNIIVSNNTGYIEKIESEDYKIDYVFSNQNKI